MSYRNIAPRIGYAERIEQFFRSNPTATLREAHAKLGAPRTVIRTVRLRMVSRGDLQAKTVDSLRAV